MQIQSFCKLKNIGNCIKHCTLAEIRQMLMSRGNVSMGLKVYVERYPGDSSTRCERTPRNCLPVFPNPWIGRFRPHPWLARSIYLTPLDFFLLYSTPRQETIFKSLIPELVLFGIERGTSMQTVGPPRSYNKTVLGKNFMKEHSNS